MNVLTLPMLPSPAQSTVGAIAMSRNLFIKLAMRDSKSGVMKSELVVEMEFKGSGVYKSYSTCFPYRHVRFGLESIS